MKQTILELAQALRERLNGVGDWLAPLGLRVILWWEFWEAGMEKLHGDNWFAYLQEQGKFPFPFNLAPTNLSWGMAMWFEIIGSLALLLGLGTRFFGFSLLILTFVATASVHWPSEWNTLAELWQGYSVSSTDFGNYKLPLLYILMLLPLILKGPGKLSLDALVVRFATLGKANGRGDFLGWGVVLFALGLPIATLLPMLGLALAGLGAVLVIASRVIRV